MAIKTEKVASGDNDKVSDDVDDKETVTDDDAGGDDDTEKVSRSAYKKAVSKEKSARERARIAEEKLAAAEQAKLEAQGNKDEQIKSLSSKLKEQERANRALANNMAKDRLSTQIAAAANSAGMIDSDDAMSIMNDLDIDPETMKADPQDVQAAIADLRKRKPHLFAKGSPKINGKMPRGGDTKEKVEEKEDLSKLSMADLKKRLADMDRKNKK